MSYEEEDTCMSYEEEDTCISKAKGSATKMMRCQSIIIMHCECVYIHTFYCSISHQKS